jgi:transposase
VRVSTAFNRVLALPGTWVTSVEFTDAGIVLGVRARSRRHRCACGWSTAARYDVSRRRWRHLDMGAARVWLEADITRIACRRCARVRTEQLPWARPGARHTRDFEQVIGWLAQRMDKTAIAQLLRCAWETVDAAVKRLVVDHTEPIDGARLNGLYRIGVDEISYKRGHQYLTVVADHDTGRVVWVARERSQEAVQQFLDALGPQRAAAVQAVTLDGSSIYAPVLADGLPEARLCLDPFHVTKWVNEALDKVYAAQPARPAVWNGQRYTRLHWRRTRTALRTGGEHLDLSQRELVNAVRRTSHRLWRAWQLKEEFRHLYRLDNPKHARAYLRYWCTSPLRSKIPEFRSLVNRLEKHLDAIIAAVELGLSNSRLEGINAKIRVIQRRGYGHPDPDALAAMIHLCLGGITLILPGRPTET